MKKYMIYSYQEKYKLYIIIIIKLWISEAKYRCDSNKRFRVY